MKHLFVFAILCSWMVSSTVGAGGYFVGEQGARAAGRGGAFTVKADDPTAQERNPAGLALQRGTTIYFSNRFGYINEQFTRAPTLDWGNSTGGVPPYVEFEPVSNANQWQLLNPMLIAVSDFGFDNLAFALGITSPPGIASPKFPLRGGQRYMMLERDVKILNYNASVAWKISEKFGIGTTLQWIDLAALRFKLIVDGAIFSTSVNPVSSRFDITSTLEGADHFTMTAIVGAWYKPTRNLEFAFSGRIIPVTLLADATLDVAFTAEQMGEEEITLYRRGTETNDVTLSLPMPASFQIGARYIHLCGTREWWDVEFNVGLEAWSFVKRFEMNGDGLMAEALGQSFSVDRLIMEKQWQNVYTFRLGGDLHLIPNLLTLRSGVFYETPAAKSEYANVDFFASHQLGAGLGGSITLSGLALSLAYTYLYQLPVHTNEGAARVFQQLPGSSCDAPYESNNCNPHYLGQPGPAVNGGRYNAEYHFLSLSAMVTF